MVSSQMNTRIELTDGRYLYDMLLRLLKQICSNTEIMLCIVSWFTDGRE
jgi:hypothetical protein